MIRQATEDTILTIPNDQGEEGTRTIAVQKGAEAIVDMVGVRKYPFHRRTVNLDLRAFVG